jgi:hypothetical protein
VHEVAQALAPASRVVYVDHDPVVLSHARALMVPSPQRRCAFAGCDLRDTGGLISQAARTLDFTEPIAVLLIAVLHFIPDADDPLGDRAPPDGRGPGSYLVISHATPEHLADAASTGRLNAVYAQTAAGGVTPRLLPEIAALAAGGLAACSTLPWTPPPASPSSSLRPAASSRSPCGSTRPRSAMPGSGRRCGCWSTGPADRLRAGRLRHPGQRRVLPECYGQAGVAAVGKGSDLGPAGLGDGRFVRAVR